NLLLQLVDHLSTLLTGLNAEAVHDDRSSIRHGNALLVVWHGRVPVLDSCAMPGARPVYQSDMVVAYLRLDGVIVLAVVGRAVAPFDLAAIAHRQLALAAFHRRDSVGIG